MCDDSLLLLLLVLGLVDGVDERLVYRSQMTDREEEWMFAE